MSGDAPIVTSPVRLAFPAIRQYAERVGHHHEIYDTSGRADIDGLVKRLGGTVSSVGGAESLRVTAPGRFTVLLPSFASARRDRFTKARELGHYFLHYRFPGLTGEASFPRGGRSLAETQANVFVSTLLMPRDEFTDAHHRLVGDIGSLARFFDVSPAAAKLRAQILDLA